MSIRTILYGYEVVNGKNTIRDYEAAVVNEIFTDYINGKSLKVIAAKLTEKGIAYYLDKTVWTKNLVSRIIANPKYIGEDGYPAIISQSVFDLANKRKSTMGGTQIDVPHDVAEIKSRTVCGKCGHNIGRHSEWLSHNIKWECPKGCRFDTYLNDTEVFDFLLNILNGVIKVPELLLIRSKYFEYTPSLEVIRQSKEIERVKEQIDVEFGVLSKMILQCTSLKYECCELDRSQAMTEVLMDKYMSLHPINEIDLALIRDTVQKITVNTDGTLTVMFINGAEVSSFDTEEQLI